MKDADKTDLNASRRRSSAFSASSAGNKKARRPRGSRSQRGGTRHEGQTLPETAIAFVPTPVNPAENTTRIGYRRLRRLTQIVKQQSAKSVGICVIRVKQGGLGTGDNLPLKQSPLTNHLPPWILGFDSIWISAFCNLKSKISTPPCLLRDLRVSVLCGFSPRRPRIVLSLPPPRGYTETPDSTDYEMNRSGTMTRIKTLFFGTFMEPQMTADKRGLSFFIDVPLRFLRDLRATKKPADHADFANCF
jgi:hypothetical protein